MNKKKLKKFVKKEAEAVPGTLDHEARILKETAKIEAEVMDWFDKNNIIDPYAMGEIAKKTQFILTNKKYRKLNTEKLLNLALKLVLEDVKSMLKAIS